MRDLLLMLLLGQAHGSPVPIAWDAYTMPSVRLLLQTTSAVTSSVTVMGSAMKGQRMLLGGSRRALPEMGHLLK